MHVEFYGAAGEVTGSCHIVEFAGHRLLIDCGLIQGGRRADERNREPFPFDPAGIDAIVLTHAHIDHSGRLPLIVNRGFAGPIVTNPACRDLCRILLADSASLAERDAERASRRAGGGRIEPLYTVELAMRAVDRMVVQPYDVGREVLPGARVSFRDAGHILGSASVELLLATGADARRLVFSGDLGQYDSPILRDPADMGAADMVVMESTYGDRLHRDRAATVREFGEILQAAWHDGGNVLIPAFAIGRTQEVLYHLGRHYDEWELARWRIFLDSPMGIEASEVYWQHADLFDEESLRLRREFDRMPGLPNLTLSRTADESRAINRLSRGAMVIAGSGMCTGGRILHHLRHNLARPQCHVIFTGFQAEGTLGRAIVDGRQHVRIHDEEVRVAAQVHTLGGFSAHGDQHDLMRWYAGFDNRPPVWLVHGESAAAAALAARLADGGAAATVATRGMRVDLRALMSVNRP